jgi:hypothetical protein
MNEQISLAFSVQIDGTASYALSITPEGEDTRSVNLSSLGADATDLCFIASVNQVIAEYRTAKGF